MRLWNQETMVPQLLHRLLPLRRKRWPQLPSVRPIQRQNGLQSKSVRLQRLK
jgi:hypothetical protein